MVRSCLGSMLSHNFRHCSCVKPREVGKIWTGRLSIVECGHHLVWTIVYVFSHYLILHDLVNITGLLTKGHEQSSHQTMAMIHCLCFRANLFKQEKNPSCEMQKTDRGTKRCDLILAFLCPNHVNKAGHKPLQHCTSARRIEPTKVITPLLTRYSPTSVSACGVTSE